MNDRDSVIMKPVVRVGHRVLTSCPELAGTDVSQIRRCLHQMVRDNKHLPIRSNGLPVTLKSSVNMTAPEFIVRD